MGRKKGPQKKIEKTKIFIKGKSSSYYKGAVTIDYSPNKQHELYKTHKNKPFFPIFNKDKKYYTPTFIIKQQDIQNDEDLKRSHQNKIKQYLTEIPENQILFAKPKSKHKYCGVCKDQYQDYKEHIQSENHKICNKNAKFSKEIKKLIDNFKAKKQLVKLSDYEKTKNQEQYWGTSNQTLDKNYIKGKKHCSNFQ